MNMFLQYKFLPFEKFDVHIIYHHPVLLQSLLSSYLRCNQSNLLFRLCFFLSLPSYLHNRPALCPLRGTAINTGSNGCGYKWKPGSSLIHIMPTKLSDITCVLTRIRRAVVFCRSLEGLMLLYKPPCSDI